MTAEALYGLTYAAALWRAEANVPFKAYAAMVIKHRLTGLIHRWLTRDRAAVPLSAFDTVVGNDEGAQDGQLPIADPAPAAESVVADRERCRLAKSLLPARWFDVLWDYFAVGHTLQEMADRTGITRQAVRFTQRRALKRVRRNLRGGLECGV